MEVDQINKKTDEFNSLDCAKMTYYIRPICVQKQTTDHGIVNRIFYADTNIELSEKEASNVLDNTDAICEMTCEHIDPVTLECMDEIPTTYAIELEALEDAKDTEL